MLHTRLLVATETDGIRPRAALSITAPEEPIPVSIVFAIDRSGSTSSDATPGLPEGSATA